MIVECRCHRVVFYTTRKVHKGDEMSYNYGAHGPDVSVTGVCAGSVVHRAMRMALVLLRRRGVRAQLQAPHRVT